MNKTSRNYFLLAIILFIVSFFYCKDGKPQPISDSTNKIKLGGAMWTNTAISFDTTKPKVQYFLKLPYTQDQFRKKIDTIYQVTMQIGKSMTVDQSEQLKGFVLSVIGRLSNDAKIDSTKK